VQDAADGGSAFIAKFFLQLYNAVVSVSQDLLKALSKACLCHCCFPLLKFSWAVTNFQAIAIRDNKESTSHYFSHNIVICQLLYRVGSKKLQKIAKCVKRGCIIGTMM
jgi:hypothetical protein